MTSRQIISYITERGKAWRLEEGFALWGRDIQHAADCRRIAIVVEQIVQELEEMQDLAFDPRRI